ncbi:MAG: hypothetical protein QW757_00840 [Candidatus Woesearchaeota archaeon]
MTLENVLTSVNQETIREWITEIEERYQSVKKKVNSLNLDNWPKPFSRKPSYLVNGKEKTLDELTGDDFNPIINSLNGILDLSTFKKEEKNIIARSMAILNTVFWNFKERKPKKRKYESVYSLSHLLTVASMFENPDLETLLVALNHDTIEDSYRHKVLKAYYKGEQISKEDAELIGLSEQELKVSDKRVKRRIYNRHLKELINRTINLMDLSKEKAEKLKIYLDALTHRVYESYETYLRRLVKTSLKLGNEGYKLILAKAYDRLDNSHFNPPYNSPEKLNGNATKVLKDAVKDVFVLEVINHYVLANKNLTKEQIKELLKVKVSLGALLNRNMTQLMLYIRNNYSSMKLKINEDEKDLEYWFNECETRLFKYYQEGGFNQRDYTRSSNKPNEIFIYNGSITSLSKFIEEKREHLFKDLNEPLEILRLYKFCAVAKSIGCLNTGHIPFVNERLITNREENDSYGLNSLGEYNPKLLRFQISGVVV